MLQGMTAHYLACTRPFRSRPGDTALVHAAAGGVGLLLVQIAKRRGARVIGTVSTEEKARAGARGRRRRVILYTQQDFEAETRRASPAARACTSSTIRSGKTTFDKSLNCLAPRGYMVLFGQSSGPVPPFDPQVLNAKGSLFLTRPTVGHYVATREELLQRAEDLFRWIQAGELRLHIGARFPLADAAEAHRQLEGRRTSGKVLLIP